MKLTVGETYYGIIGAEPYKFIITEELDRLNYTAKRYGMSLRKVKYRDNHTDVTIHLSQQKTTHTLCYVSKKSVHDEVHCLLCEDEISFRDVALRYVDEVKAFYLRYSNKIDKKHNIKKLWEKI